MASIDMQFWELLTCVECTTVIHNTAPNGSDLGPV